TKGNFEEAIDWLRAKGIAGAAKKAGRTASEGLIGIATSEDGSAAVLVEVNSETDFVAKNENFQKLVSDTAQAALEAKGDLEALNETTCKATGKKVKDVVTESIATI